MKKLMIIGSVHTDLIQYVRQLPKGNEAPEVIRNETRVSGGGFAAGRLFSTLGFPFDVFCDPGESVYGQYARKEAEKYGIRLPEGSGEIGGCTYTLIGENGDQGVFCVDGSEYHFSLSMLYDSDPDEYGAVCVFSDMMVCEGCEDVIEALRELELPVYAVFSSRASEVSEEVREALYALEPVMIMRDSDAYEIIERKTSKLEEAAKLIHQDTKAPVILLTKDGSAYYLDDTDSWMAPAKQKGETDLFAAAYIASRMAGVDNKNGMMFANENSRENEENTMKKRLAGMILHR